LTDQPVSAFVPGLTAGTTYFFRVAASNSAGPTNGLILSFTTIAFSDDFSTDTTGTYTFTPTSGTGGTFTWDSIGNRVQALTGIDNVQKVSKAIPATDNGVFSLDFNPTTAYPSHGGIWVRLVQDANNYYEISNFDYSPSGNPPGLPDLAQIIKVVGGVVTDNVFLPQTAYTQNTTFNLSITFSPTQVILQGFGTAVTLNTTNTTAISATGFEIETGQQDAFYDNILLVVGP
jgi:hypothetical protein